jgi:hypothetical protein
MSKAQLVFMSGNRRDILIDFYQSRFVIQGSYVAIPIGIQFHILIALSGGPSRRDITDTGFLNFQICNCRSGNRIVGGRLTGCPLNCPVQICRTTGKYIPAGGTGNQGIFKTGITQNIGTGNRTLFGTIFTII